ncbi:MAG: nitronate monooxygenase [Candidatus Thorarchaeota archaeon]
MDLINTKLCEILGIQHPIIQGGMGPYRTESLAIAVSRAGALGVISSIGMAASLLPEAAPIDSIRLFGEDAPTELLRKSIERVTRSLQTTLQRLRCEWFCGLGVSARI